MVPTKNMSIEDEGTVFLLIGSLMENTGAHGIPNIKRAGNPFRRIMWALLFLFGFTMFAVQSTALVSTYLLYDVDVNFEMAYGSKVEFPAVTICNMNPIKSTYLMRNDKLFELFYGTNYDSTRNQTSAYVFSGSENWWQDAGTTTAAPLKISTTSSSAQHYQDWDELDYTEEESEYNQLLFARDLIADMPYDDRRKSGHELDDMLLSCSFSGYPCSPGNFSHFYNYRYGNCFTFVGPANDSYPRRTTTKAGPLYGLTLEMYVEQVEYVSEIQGAAGIRVTVHPHDMMPFPEDNGVSISPGQQTSIGLKRIEVRHLSEPYSNCTPPDGVKRKNVFYRQFPKVKYNKEMCEKSCLYTHTLNRCNCTDPRYRYNTSDGAICWSNSDYQDDCVEGIEEQYVNGNLHGDCNCSIPCSYTTFETIVSASLWPNDKYKNCLSFQSEGVTDQELPRNNYMFGLGMAAPCRDRHLDTVIDGIGDVPEIWDLYRENPDDFIEHNFVKLSVFFNELNFDHVYDTEKYLWYDLLSDLGGQFGLWIGVSVLTVFEFIELIYDIFIVLMYKIRDVSIKRRKKRSQSVTELKNHTPVFSFDNKISP